MAEISLFLFIWHTGILKQLEYHNYDFSRLIGNHFCTSCENIVRFGLEILEF